MDKYIMDKIMIYLSHPVADIISEHCKNYRNGGGTTLPRYSIYSIYKNFQQYMKYYVNQPDIKCPLDCTCRLNMLDF